MNALDKDAARQLLDSIDPAIVEWHPSVLDGLEGCVRPAPRQTIDRVALLRELMLGAPGPGATAADFEEHADRILALLRPVDSESEYEAGYITGQRDAAGGYWRRDVEHGVTLSREETAMCAAALDVQSSQRVVSMPDDRKRWALQERLEASS